MSKELAETVAAVRQALEKATPGPWAFESVNEQGDECCVGTACRGDTTVAGEIERADESVDIDECVAQEVSRANAVFIVTAINALPVLLAAVEGAQWQDIATAPKGSWLDGPDDTRDPAYVAPPHVWLLLPDHQRCVGSADAYYAAGGSGWDGGSYWVEEFSGERVSPTHWMPLPDPPVAAPVASADGDK